MKTVATNLVAAMQFALVASCTNPQVREIESHGKSPTASTETAPSAGIGFPRYPPNLSADPSVTHAEEFVLPLRFVASRNEAQVGVSVLNDPADSFTLPVGKGMSVGYRDRMYLRDARASTESQRQQEPFSEGIGSGPPPHRVGEGIAFMTPEASVADPASHWIEVTVDFFETDLPPQHAWLPFTSRYKVLWSKTYRVSLPTVEGAR